MEEAPKQEETAGEQESTGLWTWVVTGVVVVVVIFGLYAWPKEETVQEQNQEPVAAEEQPDVQAQALEQVLPSDEIDDIEKDLQSTDISNIDKEISDIETEINAQE